MVASFNRRHSWQGKTTPVSTDVVHVSDSCAAPALGSSCPVPHWQTVIIEEEKTGISRRIHFPIE